MPRLRHLVVVVPGIGGSVLVREGDLVWGDLVSIGRRIFDARPLDAALPVTPHGLIRSTSIVPGLTALHGYSGLVRSIERTFEGVTVDTGRPDRRNLDADVVLFGYDFRDSIAAAAERLADEIHVRVVQPGHATSGRSVVVIAHSLGAVVSRYWIGPLEGSKHCAGLITLGAPHRGAPKALDSLVNGIRVAGSRLDRATDVVRGWQSAYELLPQYRAVRSPDEHGPLVRPADLALPGLEPDRVKRAAAVHDDIRSAWIELAEEHGAPNVVSFMGCGHPTVESGTWDGERLVMGKVPTDDEAWRGDGTVPALCAAPIELDGQRAGWRRPRVRHGALPDERGIIETLASLNAVRQPLESVTAPPDDLERPWLSLDIEDTYLAGQPVLVSAAAHGEGSSNGHEIVASIAAEGAAPANGAVACPSGEFEADAWTADLAAPGGLAPGTYEVVVACPSLPGVVPVRERILVASLEPDLESVGEDRAGR